MQSFSKKKSLVYKETDSVSVVLSDNRSTGYELSSEAKSIFDNIPTEPASISHEKLTQELAKEYDFDNNSEQYITSFLDELVAEGLVTASSS